MTRAPLRHFFHILLAHWKFSAIRPWSYGCLAGQADRQRMKKLDFLRKWGLRGGVMPSALLPHGPAMRAGLESKALLLQLEELWEQRPHSKRRAPLSSWCLFPTPLPNLPCGIRNVQRGSVWSFSVRLRQRRETPVSQKLRCQLCKRALVESERQSPEGKGSGLAPDRLPCTAGGGKKGRT